MPKRKPFTPDPATVRWAIRRVRNMQHLFPADSRALLDVLADDLRETSRQIVQMRKPKKAKVK